MIEDNGATAEVVDESPVVEEQPKTMDDTIRDTLRSLKDKGLEVEKEPEAPEAPEEKAQRIRDDHGKFKAKEVAEHVPDAPVVETTPAPNTWKKEAAEKWAKLPPEIQAEVSRREADFHKGIEQYRNAAQFAQTMERAITPHIATLQKLGVSPDKAVSELMNADARLRQGDIGYFASLAGAYGFDRAQLAQIFSGEQLQPQQVDPTVSAMQQKVQQLEGWIQQQTMMGQQKEQETLNSEIASFAADPSHSHFESVKGHMAALLQAGQANDLASAYEQAIYANPQTRALVIAEQQNAARAEAAKKAQAAKVASSVNVRPRAALPTAAPIGTMDETIRANLRRLTAG